MPVNQANLEVTHRHHLALWKRGVVIELPTHRAWQIVFAMSIMGLQSFTFQLNVSALCGIGGALRVLFRSLFAGV